MEDGPAPGDLSTEAAPLNNGVGMAHYLSNADEDPDPKPATNGDHHKEEPDSSDCDQLVIDEAPQRPRKRKTSKSEPVVPFRPFKRARVEQEFEPPTNPYFSESLIELSQQHRPVVEAVALNRKGGKGKKGSPRLREYAQYLGLQPTVQFKCSQCGRSGFASLAALNEHYSSCNSDQRCDSPTTSNSVTGPSTNIRVSTYFCHKPLT